MKAFSFASIDNKHEFVAWVGTFTLHSTYATDSSGEKHFTYEVFLEQGEETIEISKETYEKMKKQMLKN